MKAVKYYDEWREDIFRCDECPWVGKGSELEQGELFEALTELLCPKCSKNLVLLMLPTTQESRDNWDKLSDQEKAWVESIEKFRQEFENSKLTDDTPLPDIDEPAFELVWDFVKEGEKWMTAIRHGELIIHKEIAVYEGSRQFERVCEILKRKYGDALTDLVPVKKSELYLYGDRLASIGEVARARKKLNDR